MSDFLEQIQLVVRATTVWSPTSYLWFGSMPPLVPSRITRALSPATARGYLLYTLQTQLYERLLPERLRVSFTR